MKITDKLTDPRDYQILFLITFLSLGILNRDWNLHWQYIVLVTSCCITLQIILDSVLKKTTLKKRTQEGVATPAPISSSNLFGYLNFQGYKSALITSLGLSLLLRTNNPETFILAGICAIVSKFIFKYRGKHFFNPANFGIIMALIFTQSAWVTPGQWGSDWWYGLLFLATGAMVLKKVGRWETTAVFLAVYGGLVGCYDFYLGWTTDVVFHQLMSGSLLVFAFFMLTDPRSIPNAKQGRMIWATIIAVLGFVLTNLFYINNGIFWALFVISPVTNIIDLLWQDNRFRWLESPLQISKI